MKLKDFRKKMQKEVFSTADAHVVGFLNDPKLINLQLHQWKKNKDIIQLKRGCFMFADYKPSLAETAASLCNPCYFSLEYVLNLHGIMPESVFAYTLVTTKRTRQFKTPVGHFFYHSIKKSAFSGFDPKTLMAEPEKALVDYFYLNSSRLKSDKAFWKELRLTPLDLSFNKIFRYAKLFNSKKLLALLTNFQQYAKT